jgi:hypothetical protein
MDDGCWLWAVTFYVRRSRILGMAVVEQDTARVSAVRPKKIDNDDYVRPHQCSFLSALSPCSAKIFIDELACPDNIALLLHYCA